MTTTKSIYIAGQTASGKSELALELAHRLGGEIISVDAMQVYKGMDIGTAKPSPEERRSVPHHLIDVVEVRDGFDVAQFVSLTHSASLDIRRRKKIPIFSGGTGLYFKALLEGLDSLPAADPQTRHELQSTPLAELVLELQRRDPLAAEKIDLANSRRVIRAIEILRTTNRPLAESRLRWSGEPKASKSWPHFFGLQRTPEDLQKRIDTRVDLMFQRGLVEETRHLRTIGLEENRTAMQAIGYRQVLELLRGQWSLEETVSAVKVKTRQYAKRQKTWFKRQAALTWFNLEPGQPASGLVDVVVKTLRI